MLGGLIPIHLWHIAVHHDKLVSKSVLVLLFQKLHCILSVTCGVNSSSEVKVRHVSCSTLQTYLERVDVKRLIINNHNSIYFLNYFISHYFLLELTLILTFPNIWQVLSYIRRQHWISKDKHVQVLLLVFILGVVILFFFCHLWDHHIGFVVVNACVFQLLVKLDTEAKV
jgi:hypothetical protein